MLRLTRAHRRAWRNYRQGLERYEAGDPHGAAALLREAVDAGYRDLSPHAGFYLGLCLSRLDDPAGAAAAYERSVESGHRDAGPAAAVNLGVLRETQGDQPGAAAAYRQAIASGHPVQAPHALTKLAWLQQKQGDFAQAEANARRVFDYPATRYTEQAALQLSLLAIRQGRLADARLPLQRLASEASDPDLAAAGHSHLASYDLVTGGSVPLTLARLRELAAAGEPHAVAFLGLVEQAMDIDADAGPDRSDPPG